MNFETFAAMPLGTSMAYLGTSVVLTATVLLWSYTPSSKRQRDPAAENRVFMAAAAPGLLADRSEYAAAVGDLAKLEELHQKAGERRKGELYPLLSILAVGVAMSVSSDTGGKVLAAVALGWFILLMAVGAAENAWFVLAKWTTRRKRVVTTTP